MRITTVRQNQRGCLAVIGLTLVGAVALAAFILIVTFWYLAVIVSIVAAMAILVANRRRINLRAAYDRRKAIVCAGGAFGLIVATLVTLAIMAATGHAGT